jgi:hypothetical protein
MVQLVLSLIVNQVAGTLQPEHRGKREGLGGGGGRLGGRQPEGEAVKGRRHGKEGFRHAMRR